MPYANNKERLSVCPVFVPLYNSGPPHPILTKLSTRNLPSLGMTNAKKNFDFAKKFRFREFFLIFFEVLVLLILGSILKFDFFANIR